MGSDALQRCLCDFLGIDVLFDCSLTVRNARNFVKYIRKIFTLIDKQPFIDERAAQMLTSFASRQELLHARATISSGMLVQVMETDANTELHAWRQQYYSNSKMDCEPTHQTDIQFMHVLLSRLASDWENFLDAQTIVNKTISRWTPCGGPMVKRVNGRKRKRGPEYFILYEKWLNSIRDEVSLRDCMHSGSVSKSIELMKMDDLSSPKAVRGNV